MLWGRREPDDAQAEDAAQFGDGQADATCSRVHQHGLAPFGGGDANQHVVCGQVDDRKCRTLFECPPRRQRKGRAGGNDDQLALAAEFRRRDDAVAYARRGDSGACGIYDAGKFVANGARRPG